MTPTTALIEVEEVVDAPVWEGYSAMADTVNCP
jgi:hypothetical protein